MKLRLGIDVACRAAHQATLADHTGTLLWSGRRFRTAAEELERFWALLPVGVDPGQVVVIMEPTRNAWVPLAAWVGAKGAQVVLVPPEQSADLRDYYHKHAKTDRLDSRVLARLPLLHPEGLRPIDGLGPGEALRRAVRLRANLVKRRAMALQRLDALLELLGPFWTDVLGTALPKTALVVLERYADPHALKRLGKTRLTRLLYRHSRGAWGQDKAQALLDAADQTWPCGARTAWTSWSSPTISRWRFDSPSSSPWRSPRSRNASTRCTGRPILTSWLPQGLASARSWRPRSLAASATPSGSPTSPASGHSLAWCPPSTSPAPAAGMVGRPRPATPTCARRCSTPPIMPAVSIPPWPPATTGS